MNASAGDSSSRDLVVGCIAGLSFHQIAPWVGSLEACGFQGRRVVIHTGADAATIEALTRRGFETRHGKKGSVGFFHGTGHGLGLAVHEPPRVSAADQVLKKGTVVTVEPGLYYPGLGGCRIEDVVQVTAKAPRMLSRYSYAWEL